MNVNPTSDKCHDDRETLHRECQKALDKDVPCTREKTLILVAFIFSILVLSLLTAVIIAIVVKVMVPQQDLCLTRHCVVKGASMLRTMNTSVDPCNDFYQYACGGWAEHNDIEDDSETAIMQKMQVNLYKRLDEIMGKQDRKSAVGVIQKAANAYDSCLDLYKTKTDIGTIFEELGQWPMTKENWVDNDKIKPLEIFFQSYGFNSLFKLEIEANTENTTENIVYISPPNINFNEMLNNAAIKETIKNVLTSSKENYANIDEDFNAIEKVFKDIKTAMDTSANDTIVNRTYSDLSTIFPTEGLITDPKAFFTEVFKDIRINGEEARVDDLKFAVRNKNILEKIFKIPELATRRVLTNYLAIMYMLQNSVLLSSYQNGEPRNEKEERYSCLHFLSSNINSAIDHLYVTNVKTSSLPKVEDVVSHIKEAFSNLMKEYNWIQNETTRSNLQKKLTELKYYIGYPEALENATNLTKDYEKLDITGKTNVEVYFKVKKFAHVKYLEMAFKKNDRNKWPDFAGWSVTTVNAFYSPYLNIFVLPISILGSPIYHPENFRYLIYGSLGSIIGHEITHGFDTMGRKRNELGQKENILTPEDIQNYQEISDCFINQYNDFKLKDGFHMDGKQTVAENIADNGGLHEAYHAYLLWLKQNGRKKEQALPGLQDKTLEQMFFISFAQTWCEVATLSYLKRQIENDEHSPNKFRVLGSLSNMEEFAKAFKCAEGTNMNPKNKCVLW